MSEYRHSTLIAFVVITTLVIYAIFGISFIKSEEVEERYLKQITSGETPVYISHRGLGYYYTYIGQDGEETSEFIPSEKVQNLGDFTTDGSRPRVEYVYKSGTYQFRYPGGSFAAVVKPYFDSVRFLVPEGAIADF